MESGARTSLSPAHDNALKRLSAGRLFTFTQLNSVPEGLGHPLRHGLVVRIDIAELQPYEAVLIGPVSWQIARIRIFINSNRNAGVLPQGERHQPGADIILLASRL